MNPDLIYQEIEREYDYQRQENERIERERKKEIADRIPAYKELAEQGIADSLVTLRARLEDADGTEQSPIGQPFSFRELTEKKKALLVQNGYPADYLMPVFRCRDCEDTGYIRDAYGVRKIPCHCYQKKLTEKLAAAYGQLSGLFDLIKTENFEHLSEAFYEGEDLTNFKRAEQLCREFVSNGCEGYQNFLFYGNIGTGKSFLSVCMAAEFLKQGKEVLYFSSVTFFEKLSALQFSNGSESRSELSDLRNEIYSCDLLILDDLGTERVNQFIMSELFATVNERIRREKSTVISTNLTLQNLSDVYSERVLSRIVSGYTLCKLTGRDIRLEKARMRNRQPEQ